MTGSASASRPGTSRQVVIIAMVTLTVGIGAAALATTATDPARRTLAGTASVTMSIISIGVPFIAAVLAVAQVRAGRPGFGPMYARTLGWAVGLGAVGITSGVVIAAVAGATIADLPAIMVGSIVAEAVAHLVGTGLGLLVARPVIASALTVVLPIGLWLLLTVIAPGARDWLTPLPSANRWWSGTMTANHLSSFLTMLVLWAGVTNVAGIIVTRRRWANREQSS